MKIRYKVIILGLLVFATGLSVMLIDVNVKSIYVMQTTKEIFLVIGLVSSGLSVIGIALMYDFVTRKYEIRK